MYEIYQRLLDEKGLKNADISRGTGVSNMTLSDWKHGKSTPKYENMKKIAKFLDVTVEYLTGEENDNSEKNESSLTKRDEKDICAILSNTEELLRQPGLMFDGNPASQEAIDSILSAMQIGMEMAKKKNKELYTPKKHKKGTVI